jgi:hypothetical protein
MASTAYPLNHLNAQWLHTAVMSAGDVYTTKSLRPGVQVQVQVLSAPQLEFGEVAEIFYRPPGAQPLVRLASGTVGAVCFLLPVFFRASMNTQGEPLDPLRAYSLSHSSLEP